MIHSFYPAKGVNAVKALQLPSYRSLSKVPPVGSAEEAQRVLQDMLDAGLFVRASSINGSRYLQPDLTRTWGDEAVYVWVWQGSQVMNILASLGLILVAVVCLMYPMWPYKLRLGAWYLMMGGAGLIGLLMVIAVVRVILFVLTVYTIPPGIWLFPNLWEDCSVIDSFKPLWDWHPHCRSTQQAAEKKPGAPAEETKKTR